MPSAHRIQVLSDIIPRCVHIAGFTCFLSLPLSHHSSNLSQKTKHVISLYPKQTLPSLTRLSLFCMETEEKLWSGVGEEGGERRLKKERKRKRKRKRKKEKDPENQKLEQGNEEDEEDKEEVVARDPLEVFGRDIMVMILSNLDARSVALSLLVSRAWHGIASCDRLWSSKCEELWHGKAHIPRASQVRGLSKLAAYSISVMDGERTRIMKDDLCDHVWEFHFNKAAPEYWRNLDPYWKGTGPLMRRYFHPDGSQTAGPGDKVWGGHECCYSVVTSVVGDGKIREHYVRINRWPRMFISRNQDWSWEMSNCIYCYSSVPDADKKGGTGPLFSPSVNVSPQALGR